MPPFPLQVFQLFAKHPLLNVNNNQNHNTQRMEGGGGRITGGKTEATWRLCFEGEITNVGYIIQGYQTGMLMEAIGGGHMEPGYDL